LGSVDVPTRAALALVIALVLVACSPGKLTGEPLPSPIAPDFTLTDGPTGQVVTLSSLSGQVVLLTFLYTTCPDVCPLTAETIRVASDQLGTKAQNVAFIAVSVDPQGDTPATTRRFIADHGLGPSFRYLIGPRAALARVWQAYGVAQATSGNSVLHSDTIYLIDKHARGRVVLHSNVAPSDLAADLSILLGES
jgi:protein SCO1/2